MFDFTYAQTVAEVEKDYLKMLKEYHTAAIKAQIEIISKLVHLKIYIKWQNNPLFNAVNLDEGLLTDLEAFKGNMSEIYEVLDEISSKHVDYLERMLKEQLKPK